MNSLLFLHFPLPPHVSLPVSLAAVERTFSASRLIMPPQRARLFSEMLEILVYLKCNCNFLENKIIDSTWHSRFVFKKPNDCQSWSRSRWSRLQSLDYVHLCTAPDFIPDFIKLLHRFQTKRVLSCQYGNCNI